MAGEVEFIALSSSCAMPESSAAQSSVFSAADEAVFQRFDVDGSGMIEGSELRKALEASGLDVNDDQCAYMMRKYDDDRNATLDIHEFTEMVCDLRATSASGVQARLNLRSHVQVKGALDVWWSAAVRSIELESGPIVGQPKLRRERYIAIIKKVFKAMSAEYDEAEATSIAESEWESDRRGKDYLDAELFADGIFELADSWCNTVSGETYGEFLHTLFSHIAEADQSGATFLYLWKPDEAIEYAGGYDEAALVEKAPLLGLKSRRFQSPSSTPKGLRPPAAARDAADAGGPAGSPRRPLQRGGSDETGSAFDAFSKEAKAEGRRKGEAAKEAQAAAKTTAAKAAKAEAQALAEAAQAEAATQAAAKKAELQAEAALRQRELEAKQKVARTSCEGAPSSAGAVWEEVSGEPSPHGRKGGGDLPIWGALGIAKVEDRPSSFDLQWEERRATFGEKTGATGLKIGTSNALRGQQKYEDEGEYDPPEPAAQPNGWRPTAHTQSSAQWDEISYGDTAVAGKVAETRAMVLTAPAAHEAAWSSGWGVGKSAAQSDVLLGGTATLAADGRVVRPDDADEKRRGGDAAAEAPSPRQQVVEASRPNSWRPTKSSAAWGEISYGDTEVAGEVADVRNLPAPPAPEPLTARQTAKLETALEEQILLAGARDVRIPLARCDFLPPLHGRA